MPAPLIGAAAARAAAMAAKKLAKDQVKKKAAARLAARKAKEKELTGKMLDGKPITPAEAKKMAKVMTRYVGRKKPVTAPKKKTILPAAAVSGVGGKPKGTDEKLGLKRRPKPTAKIKRKKPVRSARSVDKPVRAKRSAASSPPKKRRAKPKRNQQMR